MLSRFLVGTCLVVGCTQGSLWAPGGGARAAMGAKAVTAEDDRAAFLDNFHGVLLTNDFITAELEAHLVDVWGLPAGDAFPRQAFLDALRSEHFKAHIREAMERNVRAAEDAGHAHPAPHEDHFLKHLLWRYTFIRLGLVLLEKRPHHNDAEVTEGMLHGLSAAVVRAFSPLYTPVMGQPERHGGRPYVLFLDSRPQEELRTWRQQGEMWRWREQQDR